MHQAAHDWVAGHVPTEPGDVLDVGGRNINGTVRDCFDTADSYTTVDLLDGVGVDVVADITDWKPRSKFDTVVCCEVLEHVEDPEAIVAACLRLARKDGRVIITCATDPRSPHSAVDGGALQPGEHYRNVDADDLQRWLPDGATVRTDRSAGDLYAVVDL